MEFEREYYQHDEGCAAGNMSDPDARGLRHCLDCAGVFDKNGRGVAVTDRRFDDPKE